MTKIASTVGRVVWFTPSTLTGDGRFAHVDSRKPLAAIVSHVFHDALVNLCVFDSNGMPHSRTSVPLVQADEPKPEHGYLHPGCRTKSGRRPRPRRVLLWRDGTICTVASFSLMAGVRLC